MAIQENNLGHFDYLAFHDKDASKTMLLTATTAWKWQIPTGLNRRKAPYWFLSVVSCYCDDSNGTSAGLPHFLRCKVPTDNYFSSETASPYINYPIVSQLIRDTPAGHYYAISQDNVVIQVPSNIQTIEFDLLDGNGVVIPIDATSGETLNIICKITYPARNEITDNINQTFVRSIDPKMTPHFAFTN